MKFFKNDKDGDGIIGQGSALGNVGAEVVKEQLRRELDSNPPAIGVIGVSGTGKSSLLNAMFKTQLQISHTRACTTRFLATELDVKPKKDLGDGEPARLVVIDAPGLGEDVRKDGDYLSEYRRMLPKCDVIIWLMAARNRGVSLDQQYLDQLLEFQDRIVFAVSQVDIVHPMEWNEEINLPSQEMESAIADIVADRAERIASVIGRVPEVTPISAGNGYNLERLFSKLIDSAPEKRQFIFSLLKGFSYDDFIPAALKQRLDTINAVENGES